MRCPDTQASFEQLLALLPRGRAWQNHDTGAVRPEDSVMQRILRALATAIAGAEEAICDAFLEFSCATALDDLDLWLEDYGLPNECDPTGDDLCAKVAADGGDSIEYWRDVLAGIGLVTSGIRYLSGSPDDINHPNVAATLYVRINTLASFPEASRRPPFCGNWNIGVQRLGDPDLSRAACIIDRALPAHLDAIVEFI